MEPYAEPMYKRPYTTDMFYEKRQAQRKFNSVRERLYDALKQF